MISDIFPIFNEISMKFHTTLFFEVLKSAFEVFFENTSKSFAWLQALKSAFKYFKCHEVFFPKKMNFQWIFTQFFVNIILTICHFRSVKRNLSCTCHKQDLVVLHCFPKNYTNFQNLTIRSCVTRENLQFPVIGLDRELSRSKLVTGKSCWNSACYVKFDLEYK